MRAISQQVPEFIVYNEFENYGFKFTATSPEEQWFNIFCCIPGLKLWPLSTTWQHSPWERPWETSHLWKNWWADCLKSQNITSVVHTLIIVYWIFWVLTHTDFCHDWAIFGPVDVFGFLPEASFGLRVLSLPASVCVCVCLSVCPYVCQSLACPRDNSGPVQATIAKFGPKMQKTLVKVPIVLGAIDLDLQGQI